MAEIVGMQADESVLTDGAVDLDFENAEKTDFGGNDDGKEKNGLPHKEQGVYTSYIR